MKEQLGKLSYTRLVSRTNFYREKALELEKKVMFANEQLEILEEKRKQLEKDHAKKTKAYDELHQSFQQLQARHEQLQNDYHRLKEDTENASGHEDGDNDDGRTDAATYEKRIEQFEQLLSEVQNELNEKERQLDTYKSRVRSLEKRTSSQNVHRYPMSHDSTKDAGARRTIIAYFDYSIVLYERKESIIRGHFHIENMGDQPMGKPYVCFRFYPVDASALKGKIISIEQAEQNGSGQSSRPQWVYMEDEWSENAKERGEIWVRPFEDVVLSPGEKVTLSDFQIPIKNHFDENVRVEGFVYFQNEQYKGKASNQILITF